MQLEGAGDIAREGACYTSSKGDNKGDKPDALKLLAQTL
jgi:hypothetical protein